MAIKKLPKRNEENMKERKSVEERFKESRMKVNAKRLKTEIDDSIGDGSVDIDALSPTDDESEQNDGVVTSDREEVKGVREMENRNQVSNNDVRVAQAGGIEVNKGVDEAYQEHVPEAEFHRMEDDMSPKGSVDSSTGLEDMISELPTITRFPKCQRTIASGAMKGVLTIVSAKKFSYRMMFAEEISSYLGSPIEIRIGIADNGIIVADKISSDTEMDGVFTLKKQGKAYIVYSAPLVKELTKEFSLDFSGTVSRTFSDATYGESDGKKAVYIKLA